MNAERARVQRRLRMRLGAWLPLCGLVLALATVFVFGHDRGHFYRSFIHDWNSAKTLVHATHLAWPGSRFEQTRRRQDGRLHHDVYNRFPIGGYLLVKLAILPAAGDLATAIRAGRLAMLALFCAAAALAYAALARLVGNRPVALAATLLSFSSYYMLYYSDNISTEQSPDLFGMMLVFHGMAVFEQKGRFAQLLAKACVALLLGWHVYALLAPFVALGLARELRRAWRNRSAAASAGHTLLATALRSRFTVVGAVALTTAIGVWAHNLAVEVAAFEERALTDLPSFRSLLRRTGQHGSYNEVLTTALSWPNFLTEQFHRLGGMFLPYALPGPYDEFGELPWAASKRGSLAWLGGVATVLTLGGLALARPHRLLAALAASAFCWAVPMRFQTAEPTHDYEAMFLLGMPLAAFAMLFAGAARRGGRWGGGTLAALAVALFALSCWRMGTAGPAADSAAERRLMAEFQTIRALARGKDVLVAAKNDAVYRFVQTAPPRVRVAYSTPMVDDSGRLMFAFFMNGVAMRYANSLTGPHAEAAVPADFVLAFERLDVPSLSTPNHRYVFLYDSLDALAAIAETRRTAFRTIAAGEPAEASTWNVHAGRWRARPELAYLRAPCAPDDTAGRFFLHVLPTSPRPAAQPRTAEGYVKQRVFFSDHGERFDDKCLMRVPLPDYPVARVRTGQTGADAWRVDFDPRGHR